MGVVVFEEWDEWNLGVLTLELSLEKSYDVSGLLFIDPSSMVLILPGGTAERADLMFLGFLNGEVLDYTIKVNSFSSSAVSKAAYKNILTMLIKYPKHLAELFWICYWSFDGPVEFV